MVMLCYRLHYTARIEGINCTFALYSPCFAFMGGMGGTRLLCCFFLNYLRFFLV